MTKLKGSIEISYILKVGLLISKRLLSHHSIALRCQINDLSLTNFSIFPTPWTLIGPLFINFKEIDFSMSPSLHFLSFLVLATPNFRSKIACFCIHLRYLLSDNLFVFLPSLYNHLKPLLKSDPPFY